MTDASHEFSRELMQFVETTLNSSGKNFHRPLLPSPSLRKQERLGGLGQQRCTATLHSKAARQRCTGTAQITQFV